MTQQLKFKKNILAGIPTVPHRETFDISKIDDYLDTEKLGNVNDSWTKLDKTTKLKKLLIYADVYKLEQNLSETDYDSLVSYFKDCLDKKKLHKVKEVNYNKDTGLIASIPGLVYNKSSNNFTLKNIDKKISTIKSLAPKKLNGTIKHKKDSDDEIDDNN